MTAIIFPPTISTVYPVSETITYTSSNSQGSTTTITTAVGDTILTIGGPGRYSHTSNTSTAASTAITTTVPTGGSAATTLGTTTTTQTQTATTSVAETTENSAPFSTQSSEAGKKGLGSLFSAMVLGACVFAVLLG